MEPQSDLGLVRSGPQPFLVSSFFSPASEPEAAYIIFIDGIRIIAPPRASLLLYSSVWYMLIVVYSPNAIDYSCIMPCEH
jgi:hypothetical protein